MKVFRSLSKYSVIVKFLISLLILLWIFQKINFYEIASNLTNINIFFLFLIVLLNIFSFVLMVLKWDILLHKNTGIKLRKLFSLYWASDFMSLFFLGIIGSEGYKIYYTKNKKVTFYTSFFDRIYSFIVYLFLILGLIIFYFYSKFLGIFLFVLLLVFYLFFYPKVFNYLVDRKKLSHLKYVELSLLEMVLHCVLSVFYIFSVALRFWVCFYILGVNMSTFLLIILASIVVIAISLPISVQGLGVREFLFLQFGNMFSIDSHIAISASFLIFISGLIFRIIGVIPFLLNKKEE